MPNPSIYYEIFGFPLGCSTFFFVFASIFMLVTQLLQNQIVQALLYVLSKGQYKK